MTGLWQKWKTLFSMKTVMVQLNTYHSQKRHSLLFSIPCALTPQCASLVMTVSDHVVAATCWNLSMMSAWPLHLKSVASTILSQSLSWLPHEVSGCSFEISMRNSHSSVCLGYNATTLLSYSCNLQYLQT